MIDSESSLEGHIALVTGASSGIGRAAAIALARSGASVVVNHLDGDEAAARTVVAAIADAGGRACAVAGDVSREADVADLVARAVSEFGTLHVLVNNAGIQRDAALTAMSIDAWQKVIDVNLTGQFLCAREAVREFLRRGPDPGVSRAVGKIVCISSVHQAIPWAGHANYAASKGGVRLLMETLAQELAPAGIRVNAVAPGAIRTQINNDAWATASARSDLESLIPYGRIGDPEDVARAVLWLASDASDYVTGTTVVVDGGMLLYPAFRGHG
jgi:glucose 1-dehydrogenase